MSYHRHRSKRLIIATALANVLSSQLPWQMSYHRHRLYRSQLPWQDRRTAQNIATALARSQNSAEHRNCLGKIATTLARSQHNHQTVIFAWDLNKEKLKRHTIREQNQELF
jgi:hypothetical protein